MATQEGWRQQPRPRALPCQCRALRISASVVMLVHFACGVVVDAVALPPLPVAPAAAPVKVPKDSHRKGVAAPVKAPKHSHQKGAATSALETRKVVALAAHPVSQPPPVPELLPGVVSVMGSSMKAFQELVQTLTVDAAQLQAQTQALQVGGLAQLARKKVQLEQQLQQQNNATEVLEARNSKVRKQLAKVEATYKSYEDEASRLRVQNAIMVQQLHMAQASLTPVTTPAPIASPPAPIASPSQNETVTSSSQNSTSVVVVASSSIAIANHSGDGREVVQHGAASAGASAEGANASESSDGRDGEEGEEDEEGGDEADEEEGGMDDATAAAVAASPAVQAAIGMDASAPAPHGSTGSEAGREEIADPTADADDGAAGGGLGVLSFLGTAQSVGATVHAKTAIASTVDSSLSDVGGLSAGVGAALESISADPQVIVKSLRNFGQGISQVLAYERQGEDKFQAAFDAQFAQGKQRQEFLQTEFKDMKDRQKLLKTMQKDLVVTVSKLRKERDGMRAQVAGLQKQLREQQEALASLLASES